MSTLQWRHNERNGVSNHQPHDCLLNHLFGSRSKKASKLRVTGLCDSPHKGPVTRKMCLFVDVIMIQVNITLGCVPKDVVYNKSTLAQVKMAWCRQVLNQCCLSSAASYAATNPQWVDSPINQENPGLTFYVGWRIYASMKWAILVLGNDLLPERH